MYFRICKGNLHTISAVGDGKRLSKLEYEGIDCQFKGWQRSNDTLLITPSSPTVTMHIMVCQLRNAIEVATEQIKQQHLIQSMLSFL